MQAVLSCAAFSGRRSFYNTLEQYHSDAVTVETASPERELKRRAEEVTL